MKNVYYLLIALFSSTVFSQGHLAKAERHYEQKSYVKAATHFDEYIKKHKPENAEVFLQAANAHYFNSQMREASIYYEKAFQLENGLEEPHLSHYVRSLRSVKEYEKANTIYLSYLKRTASKENVDAYMDEVRQFDSIRMDTAPSRFQLKNLDINTTYSDFGAVPYNEKVIFASARPGASKEVYEWNQQPYLSLFVSDTMADGNLGQPKLLLDETYFHDATVAFTNTKNTVYFTSSNTDKRKLVLDDGRNNNFKLFRGTMVDGKIENKEELYFNSDDFSVGHPFVSEDGKFLFFVSDMPGGYGNADIYYATIYEDGMISNPKNAGETINTSGNDFFPYLHDDVFYFASDGRVGFGGLDIFEANFKAEDTSFSSVTNLGKNVNSSFDDFAITFNTDGTTGYISSNRIGGRGDDDIYWFFREPLPCDQWIEGEIIDKKSKDKISDATVLAVDSNGTRYSTQSDIAGKYALKIPCEKELSVTVSKEGYIEKSLPFSTTDINEIRSTLNFELNKKEDIIVTDTSGVEKLKLDPIFFEYNKAVITQESQNTLKNVVEVMNDLSNMVIKIEAHTDSRGSDEYNLNLSDRRAKATQNFLFSLGIDKSRIISAIGYGESRLLNDCTNNSKCTDEAHLENRRSDFIILKR